MATEQAQTKNDLSFWVTVQYNRRFTIPPVICDLAKVKIGKKLLLKIEAIEGA